MSETAVPNHEAAHAEHATSTGVPNRKLGFWIFLASEAIFFAALIAVYLSNRGHSVVGPYPLDVFDILLTSISTFVLLMSSLTMVLAVHAAQYGHQRAMGRWLLATAGLGLGFLAFQVYEFAHFAGLGLKLSTNLFGSSFYVLTGFHGAHVAGGVLWLLILWLAGRRGRLGREPALNVEITGLYWHFVDIVWIVIFTLVYLMEVAA